MTHQQCDHSQEHEKSVGLQRVRASRAFSRGIPLGALRQARRGRAPRGVGGCRVGGCGVGGGDPRRGFRDRIHQRALVDLFPLHGFAEESVARVDAVLLARVARTRLAVILIC